MNHLSKTGSGVHKMTTIRNAVWAGLLMATVGACGSSGANRKEGENAAITSNCPAPIKRSVVRVVYGPGQATAVWMLPAGMLGSSSPQDLALLQKHVADIAERLTAEASREADRIVRFEPGESGAAITVEDANVDRLDSTREEFDRYAALSNRGECATAALLTVGSSVASAD